MAACSSCIFWDQLIGDVSHGRCRYNPPVPLPTQEYYPGPPPALKQQTPASFWTLTAQNDWCGQYQSSPPPSLMPAVSGVAPTQPAITVAAEVMLGLGLLTGFAITPIRTGRVAAIISGTLTSSTANAQINITGRHGTGTAPANGAPVTGQLWATTQHYVIKTSADVHGFTVIGGNPGLALNTPVWFDLSVASPAGGTTTIDDAQSLLFEL